MQIAVLSDSHCRYATVNNALAVIRQRKVRTVIHCGDITDAATVRLFKDLETHFVFGNCDLDRDELSSAMRDIGAHSHSHWGHLEIAKRTIAWTHGDDPSLFRQLESCGDFDFLFYGHTHVAKQHRTGKTRVVNPGALQRARIKSFVILNATTGELETVTVD